MRVTTRFRSLTARLVLTAVALTAVVSLMIGTATTLLMRSSLTDRLDLDLRASLDRAAHRPGDTRERRERIASHTRSIS